MTGRCPQTRGTCPLPALATTLASSHHMQVSHDVSVSYCHVTNFSAAQKHSRASQPLLVWLAGLLAEPLLHLSLFLTGLVLEYVLTTQTPRWTSLCARWPTDVTTAQERPVTMPNGNRTGATATLGTIILPLQGGGAVFTGP